MWNQELLHKHAGVSLMKERADSRDLKTLFNPKTLTWTFAVHLGSESGFILVNLVQMSKKKKQEK